MWARATCAPASGTREARVASEEVDRAKQVAARKWSEAAETKAFVASLREELKEYVMQAMETRRAVNEFADAAGEGAVLMTEAQLQANEARARRAEAMANEVLQRVLAQAAINRAAQQAAQAADREVVRAERAAARAQRVAERSLR